MIKTFNPLGERVLVLPDPQKESSGIVGAPSLENLGTVKAVGPGAPNAPMTLKVGDRIVYGPSATTNLTVNGEDCVVMLERNIFGTIEE